MLGAEAPETAEGNEENAKLSQANQSLFTREAPFIQPQGSRRPVSDGQNGKRTEVAVS